MLDNLYFVSGLPRSGSTLLMNILGQNPKFHVTPTSGLIELFLSIKNQWKNVFEFKAEGLEKVKHRVEGAMQGVLYGYFQDEMLDGKICFDKSRGWLQFIEDLETCLKRKIKIITTVRDVREILASFEKLYRKRGIEYNYPVGDAFLKAQTIEGRCDLLLADGGVLGITINRLRDVLNRGLSDRVIFVPYEYLTSHPGEIMKHLHKNLNLQDYEYDVNNVKQITNEGDVWHGMDLHIIRPEVKPQKNSETWREIFPKNYAEYISKKYEDINTLANSNS